MSLATAYFLFACLVCMGVMQLACAQAGLRGLLLAPHPVAARLFGLVLIAGAAAWFALAGYASIPGDVGGVEGAEQFLLFLGGAGSAALATAFLASFVQAKQLKSQAAPGMEGFRNATLIQLVRSRSAKASPSRSSRR